MVETLRASIPGHPLSPPHITILPPRPLHIPLGEVWSLVESALGGWRAFAAELSAVRCFQETDFLYLDVAAGNEQLHAMHDKLSVGPLNHAEMYGFQPHVTLGGPVTAERREAAVRQASEQWQESASGRCIPIEELVLLWLGPDRPDPEWRRFRSLVLTRDEAIAGIDRAAPSRSR